MVQPMSYLFDWLWVSVTLLSTLILASAAWHDRSAYGGHLGTHGNGLLIMSWWPRWLAIAVNSLVLVLWIPTVGIFCSLLLGLVLAECQNDWTTDVGFDFVISQVARLYHPLTDTSLTSLFGIALNVTIILWLMSLRLLVTAAIAASDAFQCIGNVFRGFGRLTLGVVLEIPCIILLHAIVFGFLVAMLEGNGTAISTCFLNFISLACDLASPMSSSSVVGNRSAIYVHLVGVISMQYLRGATIGILDGHPLLCSLVNMFEGTGKEGEETAELSAIEISTSGPIEITSAEPKSTDCCGGYTFKENVMGPPTVFADAAVQAANPVYDSFSQTAAEPLESVRRHIAVQVGEGLFFTKPATAMELLMLKHSLNPDRSTQTEIHPVASTAVQVEGPSDLPLQWVQWAARDNTLQTEVSILQCLNYKLEKENLQRAELENKLQEELSLCRQEVETLQCQLQLRKGRHDICQKNREASLPWTLPVPNDSREPTLPCRVSLLASPTVPWRGQPQDSTMGLWDKHGRRREGTRTYRECSVLDDFTLCALGGRNLTKQVADGDTGLRSITAEVRRPSHNISAPDFTYVHGNDDFESDESEVADEIMRTAV